MVSGVTIQSRKEVKGLELFMRSVVHVGSQTRRILPAVHPLLSPAFYGNEMY